MKHLKLSDSAYFCLLEIVLDLLNLHREKIQATKLKPSRVPIDVTLVTKSDASTRLLATLNGGIYQQPYK